MIADLKYPTWFFVLIASMIMRFSPVPKALASISTNYEANYVLTSLIGKLELI